MEKGHKRFFDPGRRRLVYIRESADPGFWDRQWDEFDLEALFAGLPKNDYNRLILDTTRRYLAPGSLVLEGGCGLGDKVVLLDKGDFRAIGLDFAPKTIRRIRRAAPSLRLVQGDVRRLMFADQSLDGYWSLGVVEHFFDGYDAIRDEMKRTLKPGGFLFLMFPSLSPLRRLKGRLGIIPGFEPSPANVEGFYQFALDARGVAREFGQHGFTLHECVPFNGFKGLADEIPMLELPLKVLYKTLRRPTEYVSSRFAEHSTLLVLEKRR